jgi:hypothetical protein
MITIDNVSVIEAARRSLDPGRQRAEDAGAGG